MLELSLNQRRLLAETLRDIANFAAAALIFGQLVGEQPFSIWLMLLGMAVWVCLVVLAVTLAGRKKT